MSVNSVLNFNCPAITPKITVIASRINADHQGLELMKSASFVSSLCRVVDSFLHRTDTKFRGGYFEFTKKLVACLLNMRLNVFCIIFWLLVNCLNRELNRLNRLVDYRNVYTYTQDKLV